MSDNMPASNKTLENVDFFALVELSDMSEEEKQEVMAESTLTALQIFMEDDVPNLLSPEDLSKFQEMISKEETKDEAFKFLVEKVPSYQDDLQKRVMAVKKQMIVDNIEERLAENKIKGDLLRGEQETEESRSLRIANEASTTSLQKAIKAIEEDNWNLVWNLLVPSSK